MEDIINMIVTDESPAEISDKIKEVLYSKAAENIEELKPYVAASIFGTDEEEYEEEA
jgi:hypothetical protein